MIGKLSGRIDYRGEDHVLLDVRGVGYVVFCSERTLATLPSPIPVPQRPNLLGTVSGLALAKTLFGNTCRLHIGENAI